MAYFSLYNSSVQHHELITKLNLTVRVRRLTSLSHLTETVRHILCYSRLICVIYVIIIEGLKMAEADSLGRSKRVKLGRLLKPFKASKMKMPKRTVKTCEPHSWSFEPKVRLAPAWV